MVKIQKQSERAYSGRIEVVKMGHTKGKKHLVPLEKKLNFAETEVKDSSHPLLPRPPPYKRLR